MPNEKIQHSIISVVTITFNNYDELLATLNSTAGITCIENVIINGGNCEKTKQYLETSNFNYVSEPDKGISDAFNKGVLRSTGDFIVFLNSGDLLIDKNYYNYSRDYFFQNPKIDFIFADIIFKHREHGNLIVKPNTEKGKTPFPHPSLVMRNYIFEKIGVFDLSLKVAMDYDIMCRMINENFKGHYYNQTPVVLMDGNGESSSNGIRGIKERQKVLKKNNLTDLKSNIYLKKLIAKTYARDFLNRIHLLNKYDQIKKMFIKIKSE